MKKTIGILCIAIMLMGSSVSAIKLDNTDANWVIGVHTKDINNDPDAQANMLKQLGLFIGTGKGFELERNMTRAEAAVMLVRFLGAEKKVLAGVWKHPFKDVPAWVDKYIGWLYQSGLTKGIGKTKYGSNKKTTLEQYAVFLSRAINGDDDWEGHGIASADEVELWDNGNGFFPRAAAVGLSTRALALTYTRNGNHTYAMAQYLINHGVFTADQFFDAAWGVLPAEYHFDNEGCIYNTIAGVTAGKTDIGGFYDMTGTDSALAYFYASVRNEQDASLYRIDCRTMKSTMISSDISSGDINDWRYEYASTIGQNDYLFKYSRAADTMSLVVCDGDSLHSVTLEFKFYKNSIYPVMNQNYFVQDDVLLAAGGNQYILINEDGVITHAFRENTQIIGYSGGSIVTQLTTEVNTTISCINAEDGTVLDTYTVNQGIGDEYGPRTVCDKGYGKYYGKAGFYLLDSTSGRLRQITSRPTLDLTAFRMDARNIILTHDLGERLHDGGNQIVMIDEDGNERVLLSNNPRHGILIDGFVNKHSGGTISFYSAQDQGMMHFNIFTYILIPHYDIETGEYDEKQPKIIVTGFTAARPEVEEEGYEQNYIQKEQTRLNALGFK